MKKSLFVIIIQLIGASFLIGQTQAFEITPTFVKNFSEYSTEEIQFNQDLSDLDFVGLSCYHFGQEKADIYYRLKKDKQWSSWLKFNKQHEFVGQNRSAYQAKTIYESFSSIQFKTNEKLENQLIVRFFIAGQEKLTPTVINKSFNCDMPEICDRVCWCPTCPVDNTPELTDPTHLIVHHSAGNNQSSNFANVVQFIWDLHVNTNGWDDIGYNWLIDPNGMVYSGRPDNNQGAHFSCINENTVGICVIGDYSLVEPSAAAINTLVNLLAFEATEHEIDVNAQSYHIFGDFFLDNIAGHRDSSESTNACSSTLCPGDSFYPLLGEIRAQVSELPCYNEVINATNEYEHANTVVYPNPVNNNLYIKFDKNQTQKFNLVDQQGKSMGYLYAGVNNDLSHLPSGLYFLLLDGVLLESFVKK